MDSPPDHLLMVESCDYKSVWIREDDEWQKISDVPEGWQLYCACYCRISDGIVVMGGWGDDFVSAQCYHFSVSKRQWRKIQDLQTARYNAVAVVLEGEVFVFGGKSKDDNDNNEDDIDDDDDYDDNDDDDDDDDDDKYRSITACEKLNIPANTWTSIRDLPEPLERPCVTAASGKAYIIPREQDITVSNRLRLVEYDPKHDRYSAQCQLPENVTGTHDAHLVGIADQLYLFRSEPVENGIYQYNPSNGQWSNIAVPNTPPLYSYLGEASSGKLMWTDEEDKDYEYDRDSQQWRTIDYKLPCRHLWSEGFVTIIE